MRNSDDQRVRSFYRIVKTNPPTDNDFLSNAAKGKQPRNPTPEVLRRWDGLSAFTTFEAARANAQIFRRLGRFIVELRVSEDSPITFSPHPAPGEDHVTLWGDLDDFLEAMVDVVQIR